MAKFETVRLTTAQATIRLLINQYSERDGKEYRLIPGTFGIFGHGNVYGIGQALLQNYGFSSIGALSESRGSQRFGTRYRTGDGNPHNEDGELLPVDIAKNAESWGIKVLKVHTIEEFRDAYRQAEKSEQAVMIHIETNLFGPNPPNCSYWDVAVPEVSRIESTQQARKEYEEALVDQRHYWKQ